MKKVKNLIENKDLINTFKKSKTKNNLNKSILKKRTFFFLKYKCINLVKFVKIFNKNNQLKYIFNKPLSLGCFFVNINQIKNKNFLKTTLMFIKLYLY